MAIQEPIFQTSSQVVQVRERGQVTIPAGLRRDIGLRDGDVFTVIRFGDALILVRKKLVVPELAERIAQILADERLTLEDLLAELNVQRQRYNQEKYGRQA